MLITADGEREAALLGVGMVRERATTRERAARGRRHRRERPATAGVAERLNPPRTLGPPAGE